MIGRRDIIALGLWVIIALVAAYTAHRPMPQGDFTFFDVEGPQAANHLSNSGLK
jgi:hypothetical protein